VTALLTLFSALYESGDRNRASMPLVKRDEDVHPSLPPLPLPFSRMTDPPITATLVSRESRLTMHDDPTYQAYCVVFAIGTKQ